ncbi:hypothetical protein LIA77_02490 [Sarocladium implicatum]|nr:hypothetical protein LIA77_02490 [Sarocladium implicatum]
MGLSKGQAYCRVGTLAVLDCRSRLSNDTLQRWGPNAGTTEKHAAMQVSSVKPSAR